MKLLWSSRSPFVRKVTIAMHELGVADRVSLQRVIVSSQDSNPDVMALNPLNQIPTLVLDDGTALFDSFVIIDYLNTSFAGNLVPFGAGPRLQALRLHALGEGMLRLNVLRLGEIARGERASPAHLEAMRTKTIATLDWLEREVGTLVSITIGSIAVAAGLSYLDFRFSDDEWRRGRPALAAWHDAMRQRPSMAATEPEDVY